MATAAATEDSQQPVEMPRSSPQWHDHQLVNDDSGFVAGVEDNSLHRDMANVQQPHWKHRRSTADEAWQTSSPSTHTSAWVDGWILENLRHFQQQDSVFREALHCATVGVKPDCKKIKDTMEHLQAVDLQGLSTLQAVALARYLP